MRPKKVAILTAGGLAPCLSAAIAGLIERYSQTAPEIEILCYRGGYKGLLLGDSIKVTPADRAQAHILKQHGGSPIGNDPRSKRLMMGNRSSSLKTIARVPISPGAAQPLAYTLLSPRNDWQE